MYYRALSTLCCNPYSNGCGIASTCQRCYPIQLPVAGCGGNLAPTPESQLDCGSWAVAPTWPTCPTPVPKSSRKGSLLIRLATFLSKEITYNIMLYYIILVLVVLIRNVVNIVLLSSLISFVRPNKLKCSFFPLSFLFLTGAAIIADYYSSPGCMFCYEY